ncbi:bola-like protein [Dacryopinax primogenitus]|uniref:Bola-like protein n=1 Tax=Dacryopinax primogenitus (strain DJM 731) TaxID=1858805 RepID=M5FS57_DACPD|nr:bola-like protein [Dacryopinax primogenitus]EJT97974.1 bola-like protein [Dacryopinax primogenitus]
MVAQSELSSTLRAALPKLAHLVRPLPTQPVPPSLNKPFTQEIQDQSSGCGENYYVLIVSDDFEGLITLKRHRLVNEILKKQIAEMHAFSQRTLTVKQYEAMKKAGTL